MVPARTMARFDDLSHIFPSQLETRHMRSHLFNPFGGSSQDHEQGRQQTYHMFRQRHTRSNVFQKRPPFCFNKISRRRFTEFFFFSTHATPFYGVVAAPPSRAERGTGHWSTRSRPFHSRH